jgi:hypothetical protein
MTVVQFDAWTSGDPKDAYGWPALAERCERTQLHAMRELHEHLRERKRLAAKSMPRSIPAQATELGTRPGPPRGENESHCLRLTFSSYRVDLALKSGSSRTLTASKSGQLSPSPCRIVSKLSLG